MLLPLSYGRAEMYRFDCSHYLRKLSLEMLNEKKHFSVPTENGKDSCIFPRGILAEILSFEVGNKFPFIFIYFFLCKENFATKKVS